MAWSEETDSWIGTYELSTAMVRNGGNGDWAKMFGYNFETSNVVGLTREGYSYNGDPFQPYQG
jgi:hypothetical protein